MLVLCLEDVLKSHCCLTHQTELSFCQNMESLFQSGSAELCGVKYNSECISATVKQGGRGVMCSQNAAR